VLLQLPPRVTSHAPSGRRALRGHAPRHHPCLQVPATPFTVAATGRTDAIDRPRAALRCRLRGSGPTAFDPPMVTRLQPGRGTRPPPRSLDPALAAADSRNTGAGHAHRSSTASQHSGSVRSQTLGWLAPVEEQHHGAGHRPGRRCRDDRCDTGYLRGGSAQSWRQGGAGNHCRNCVSRRPATSAATSSGGRSPSTCSQRASAACRR